MSATGILEIKDTKGYDKLSPTIIIIALVKIKNIALKKDILSKRLVKQIKTISSNKIKIPALLTDALNAADNIAIIVPSNIIL
jgi:GTP cyclohydrolase II